MADRPTPFHNEPLAIPDRAVSAALSRFITSAAPDMSTPMREAIEAALKHIEIPDWNAYRFGEERPAARHDFNALVGERNRYLNALERIESHGAGEAVRIAREALAHA